MRTLTLDCGTRCVTCLTRPALTLGALPVIRRPHEVEFRGHVNYELTFFSGKSREGCEPVNHSSRDETQKMVSWPGAKIISVPGRVPILYRLSICRKHLASPSIEFAKLNELVGQIMRS